ncbi:hypothetical protein NTG44_08765 [Pseudomonas sp. 20P_3.2_Bac4]|nr:MULTISPECIES: hypothetical protein [unclassified Pseudomonas]MCU1731797.1 hypothetical protein [Pseudomonas sp. 20P_3.2_Bac4]MCU1743079.1 hypothetical protein [Pseudomonas sp. 20P_3.2_Bac5]
MAAPIAHNTVLKHRSPYLPKRFFAGVLAVDETLAGVFEHCLLNQALLIQAVTQSLGL